MKMYKSTFAAVFKIPPNQLHTILAPLSPELHVPVSVINIHATASCLGTVADTPKGSLPGKQVVTGR